MFLASRPIITYKFLSLASRYIQKTATRKEKVFYCDRKKYNNVSVVVVVVVLVIIVMIIRATSRMIDTSIL
jgi:hypothetical protein